MRSILIASVAAVMLLVVTAGFGGAQQRSDQQKARSARDNRGRSNVSTKVNKARRPAPITRDQENAVKKFVNEHYSELSGLLVYLEESRPRDYQRAIRDMYRTRQRLETFKERDPKRYELELKAWKIQSQIELLAARLQMKDNADQRSQLRERLEQQVEVQASILALERDKLTDRVERLDAQMEKLKQRDIDRRLKVLTQTRPQPRRSAGDAKRSAGNRSDAAQKKNAQSAAKSGKQPPRKQTDKKTPTKTGGK